jgi:hypothetical protein
MIADESGETSWHRTKPQFLHYRHSSEQLLSSAGNYYTESKENTSGLSRRMNPTTRNQTTFDVPVRVSNPYFELPRTGIQR